MRNLKVIMSYNGTAYHGYQRQNNAVTVQQTVEHAASVLLGAKTAVNGCSRTDTGVHAKEFCFNMLTDNRIPCEGFVKGMNALLPQDIAIISCCEADEAFHARFDSKGKEYLYKINTAPCRDVFMQNLSLHYPYRLDIAKMHEAAAMLCGTHDFAAFCKAEAKEHLESTVRTVYSIDIEQNGCYTDIYVRGSGFLHNMVRIIVGTLIYISEGKRTTDDIAAALSTGDREKAGKTVSACGLYLNKVLY